MKAHVAPYATAVRCGRVVCRNGTTIRIAAYPVDLKMSNGTIYQSGSGFENSGFAAEASFAASVVDLSGFLGYAGVTRDMIASGVFDGARCYFFTTDFLNPVEDEEPNIKAIFGKTSVSDDKYTVEVMALIDLLGQTVGKVCKPDCDKVFGGQEYGGCGINLAAITVTGTVTSVTSDRIFRDAARTEAADRFGWGTLTFTSGSNVGLAAIRVDDYAADGTITLADTPYYPVTVGTTYSMTPGCRKRLVDCRDKYGNQARFGGDPYVPQSSAYYVPGGA